MFRLPLVLLACGYSREYSWVARVRGQFKIADNLEAFTFARKRAYSESQMVAHTRSTGLAVRIKTGTSSAV